MHSARWKRIGWFLAIWVASLVVMVAGTYGLRALIALFYGQ